jgi:hypothetical protein
MFIYHQNARILLHISLFHSILTGDASWYVRNEILMFEFVFSFNLFLCGDVHPHVAPRSQTYRFDNRSI